MHENCQKAKQIRDVCHVSYLIDSAMDFRFLKKTRPRNVISFVRKLCTWPFYSCWPLYHCCIACGIVVPHWCCISQYHLSAIGASRTPISQVKAWWLKCQKLINSIRLGQDFLRIIPLETDLNLWCWTPSRSINFFVISFSWILVDIWQLKNDQSSVEKTWH